MKQTRSKTKLERSKAKKDIQVRADQDKFNDWDLDFLIDYVLNTHHYFTWVNLPVVKEYALKVARMQGAQYPELIEVNRLIKSFASEIEQHMSEQEYRLFPYIKKLVYADRDHLKMLDEEVELCLDHQRIEHKYFKKKLNAIIDLLSASEIANQPETTPSALLFKLKAFKNDLDQHLHLEKDILFPKATSLEHNIR